MQIPFVQELPEPLDVPPSGIKQSIDTTTGEAPTQVMVSVRAVMSPSAVATVVPAAFFTVVACCALSIPVAAVAFSVAAIGFGLAAGAIQATKTFPSAGFTEFVGVPVLNPLVIVSTVLILLVIGVVAGMIPARTAASTDPIEALRK